MMRIEDYAFISDLQTCALVGRDGSIDWLCLPRFDSRACFASLLGTPENGRWLLAPAAEPIKVTRQYRGDTLILETLFETESGAVKVIDCMPPRGKFPDVVRIVEGVRGEVEMQMELRIRFDYGRAIPWVRRREGDLHAIVGPDEVILRTPMETRGEDHTTGAHFTVREGEQIPFVLTWYPSHLEAPPAVNAFHALRDTEEFWAEWIGQCHYEGEWSQAVRRSLVTLKGLTYKPTGGIVAAATTSLPEQIGGSRNWDYRYCWLRDASFSLHALLGAGFREEAQAWRDWLLRAVAGSAEQLQIMYGLAGERRLDELEIPWLPGYEGSTPVRIGNKAGSQHQLDIFGEIISTLFNADRAGLPEQPLARHLQQELMGCLEKRWREPDAGIWEVRGDSQQFTHSKVMAWLAASDAAKSSRACGDHDQEKRWAGLRDEIHREVCARGFSEKVGGFTQYYGSDQMDASLLLLPLVGFLPFDDPRIIGTVRAVEERLLADGLVQRYQTEAKVDGLEPGEGVFLLCSFWLASCQHGLGREAAARELFERVLTLRNDVGLLAEEYDPRAKRQLGNFPQAFSHVGLINTARRLAEPPAAASSR